MTEPWMVHAWSDAGDSQGRVVSQRELEEARDAAWREICGRAVRPTLSAVEAAKAVATAKKPKRLTKVERDYQALLRERKEILGLVPRNRHETRVRDEMLAQNERLIEQCRGLPGHATDAKPCFSSAKRRASKPADPAGHRKRQRRERPWTRPEPEEPSVEELEMQLVRATLSGDETARRAASRALAEAKAKERA